MYRPVGLARLLERVSVFPERWAKWGSEHSFTVACNFLFGLFNRFFELSDQSRTRAGEPLQMPAGIIEVLNGVTDGLDFFQTAKPRTQKIALR